MSEGPISIIPEDVLADIFMLAVDIGDIGLDEHYQSSGHLRSKMSIVITHVCQRWRFVAIHSPRMWTQLKICAASQGPLISLFATRSHPLGTTFTFESPGTSSLEDTITDWPPLRIMINKEAAIGIRELRFRHAAAVHALLIDEDAETALALDRVFLSGAHIKDDHTLPFPSCLFHSTQLHLVNSMLDSGSRPFRFLHELVIENSDHETLLWMLECTNMPVLRSLRLCSIRASDPKLVNTVKLPSLGRLLIESSHSFTPALIGRSLMVPNLQHLHVDDLGPQFRTDAQGSLLPKNVIRMKGVDAIKKAVR
ncbi:hypothetical protein DL93DRAFT_2090845 [Clavulina sp. PMI_390]|nr:hypothetical protein DL93DRAFT_2090845 [Clavulina sp. PMI_390]